MKSQKNNVLIQIYIPHFSINFKVQQQVSKSNHFPLGNLMLSLFIFVNLWWTCFVQITSHSLFKKGMLSWVEAFIAKITANIRV